jgi:hypothetical protein
MGQQELDYSHLMDAVPKLPSRNSVSKLANYNDSPSSTDRLEDDHCDDDNDILVHQRFNGSSSASFDFDFEDDEADLKEPSTAITKKLLRESQDNCSMPSLVSFCQESFNMSSSGSHVDLSSVLEEMEELDLLDIRTPVIPTVTTTRREPLPRAHSTTSILSAKCSNYVPDVTPRRESRWQVHSKHERKSDSSLFGPRKPTKF